MSDILSQTFCLYCQQDYESPKQLQKHVLKKHPHTYASHAILEARSEN